MDRKSFIFMIKNQTIFLILFSFLISGIDDIYETRFEKFWKKTFNQLNYREPLKFIPYNLKFGYFTYGGTDYWDNMLSGNNILETSPYILLDQQFPNVDALKYRKGFSVELDLFKYNIFHKYQNKIDILIGLGYKYKKSINASYFNDMALKPNFQGWNINATFYKQWTPKLSSYFYYSYGKSKVKFYETPNGNSIGRGSVKGISLGFNFIKPVPEKPNFNYGIEINFEENQIDNINEPINYQKIEKFESQQIGIVYFVGIGYGGNKTQGDQAFQKMLDGEYIEALENLHSFQYSNPYKSKDSEIQKLMMICREEIPQQLYKNAMREYYGGNLEEAINLLLRAQFTSDSQLTFEIEVKKFVIADEMLQNTEILTDGFSIEDKIQFYRKIEKISNKVKDKVNEKISLLFINKGDFHISQEEYEESYNAYMMALSYNSNNEFAIDMKIENLVVLLLNDVYKFLQINEHVIAYEILSYIQNISRFDENSKALMDIVQTKLENDRLKGIRERVRKILSDDRQFALKADSNDIFLGDSLNKVIKIIDNPFKMLSREKLNNKYDMLFIDINDVKYKLFFKNQILIDVEREL